MGGAGFDIGSGILPDGMRLIDLSHIISPKSPHIKGAQPPYQMTLWTTADRTASVLRRNGVVNEPGVNVELVNMTFHVGTHIDALGHFSCGDCMYGGRKADLVVGDLGLRDLDAAQIPAVFRRGVLIDVSGLDGGEHLEGGRPVTAADLQGVLEKEGLKLEAGDVIAIRTGWGRFYSERPSYYAATTPGITLCAARFLTASGAFAIGADTMSVEVVPAEDPTIVMPVHIHTLVECGVYLIENLALDELALAKERIFTFVMLPIKFKGATASPVRPLAVLPALSRQ